MAASHHIAFFGGAGVSTESGIPDFRSATGLYTLASGGDYPPEYMLSHSCWRAHPEDFYAFYRTHMLYPDAKPNPAHQALAKLEAAGRLIGVVTQNIDGLHQLAGSKKVYQVHGSVARNYCVNCGKNYPMQTILESTGIPRCTECQGIIKPDVVLYEESLDRGVIDAATRAMRNADVLIVGGTSLNVYPAAGLIDYFSGSQLVLINKTPTPADRRADLVIHEPIGQVLSTAVDEVLAAQ